MPNLNSFQTRSELSVGGKKHVFHSLPALDRAGLARWRELPFSLKILLENLLRQEDGEVVRRQDIEKLVQWDPKAEPNYEIQFMPARVLLQDFTGVPCVVDLAAMRDAMKKLGGDPERINPLQPVDLVIDHSVQVDHFGNSDAFQRNVGLEFSRNSERYQFLRWGSSAFQDFRVVPPDTGIVHQINLEYLAQVAMTRRIGNEDWVYPDTLVGTDSHTTMVNGLGVLGWGVGGIEAEAAMLGQPCSMLIPQVLGFRLAGKLPAGTTATDLVLTATQMLRKKGVVGKIVEFHGPGLADLTLADRATLANMAPEYGATAGLFPVDARTTEYLTLTGRSGVVPLVEAYYRAQGLWYDPVASLPRYSDSLELDLGAVEPCLAGPARPQDRVPLSAVPASFGSALDAYVDLMKGKAIRAASSPETGIQHGSVVIAAITSCTNTSNPSVLLAAGLLAKKAREKGLTAKPWVKTSLAPGSKVVTDYLQSAGLMRPLEELGFHLVGYGCTTCIGNSGPLPDAISKAVAEKSLCVAAVLSGNRNFEGRVNTQVRANYLASPPLVVAYAIAGSVELDLAKDPMGKGTDGKPVFLKDIWPSSSEVADLARTCITSEQFHRSYANVFEGSAEWRNLPVPQGKLFRWDQASTYVKEPPYFEGMGMKPAPLEDIRGARALLLLGDSITTDHISPAGSIGKDSPAGKYLVGLGVEPKDFNSYGARRGNHEVMVRGTFANTRIKNRLAGGVEGGITEHVPTGAKLSIYDAAMKYQAEGTPLVVFAGKEYGTGSSRDWAAKGTKLLGVRAVIAESFERIHRSNLVGMGVLPLQYLEGDSAEKFGITGREKFSLAGLASAKPGARLEIRAERPDGSTFAFSVRSRVDTPNEAEYLRHGGILLYVLRNLASEVSP